VLPKMVDEETYMRHWEAIDHILFLAEQRGAARNPSRQSNGLENNNARGVAQSTAVLTCLVDGCEERAFGLNLYCPKHRRRYQRHGDPATVLKRGRKAKS